MTAHATDLERAFMAEAAEIGPLEVGDEPSELWLSGRDGARPLARSWPASDVWNPTHTGWLGGAT